MEDLSYDDLIGYATEVITEIRRRSYGEGYEQGKFDQRMDSAFDEVAKITNGIGINIGETEQEKRDRIVEQAKEDVEFLVGDIAPKVEYVVNKNKRTIAALLKHSTRGFVVSRGIAKCAPSDCFNVHIGKAIALRRALRLEVPDEYLNAPQPTEVREGDFVKTTRGWEQAVEGPFYKGDVFEVRSDFHGIKYACAPDSGIADYCEIIDDSREGDE